VLGLYADFLTDKVSPRNINGEMFSVLVDSGNGTASTFFTALLHKKYRIFTHAINDVPDGFSFRRSEPGAENLKKAIETVKKLSLTFGAAFDHSHSLHPRT